MYAILIEIELKGGFKVMAKKNQKKPIYQRLWFKILIIWIILGIIMEIVSPSSGENKKQNSEERTSTETMVSSSPEIEYSDEIVKFARKYKISEEATQNIENALKEASLADSLSNIEGWEQVDDYAYGERCRVLIGDRSFLICVSKEKVESIYDRTDAPSDGLGVLIYGKGIAPEETEENADGTIYLADGVLGEYGKEVTIPSETYGEYTYTQYMVPSGTYVIENQFKVATVFVVSNTDSNDVVETIRFTEKGEQQDVTIEDGYHIELSERSEVLLTPKG